MNSIVSKSSSPNSIGDVSSSRRRKVFENHPAMPALLKELSPRTVASLFQELGVTDAAVLMSMMPTPALLRAFDASIWKSARPGSPKTIDYRDLIDWLTAWSDIDEQFLVKQLAAMDEDYLSTLLSRIVKVESASRYAVYWEDRESLTGLCEDDRERIGAYIVLPMVEQDREIVIDTLRALWSFDAPKLTSIFARISDLSDPADSPRGSATTLQDIEFARDSFNEASGFVAAESARAFLALAEQLQEADIIALDAYDPETRRHLDAITRASEEDFATSNPVIADEVAEEENDDQHHRDGIESNLISNDPAVIDEESNTAPLRALLEESELLPRKNVLPLLQDLRTSRKRSLAIALESLADDDIESFHARAREFAYLANVLRWVPANDTEALSDSDAKEAAFAICNLGFELATNTTALEWEKEPGLIREFLLGWKALSAIRDRVVGTFAAAMSQSSGLSSWLYSEASAGLADLRRAVESKRFDEAQEATIFLSIVFDSRVCRAIAPLLSAIPRFSALLESGRNSRELRWIETKSDLQVVERLLRSLKFKSATSRKEK